jgi:ferric enterobactin receptor
MSYIQKRVGFLCLCLLVAHLALAQRPVRLQGKIIDNQTKAAMSFASVKIIDARSLLLVTGYLSDEQGKFQFKINEGSYFIEIEYLGYKTYKSALIVLLEKDLDLGTIPLSPANQSLDELVVKAEKSTMELALDKRVFNVGKDLAHAGGTAQDILLNIPAVTVEPDGAIKLRGSNSVRILIDGKPSGLVSFKGGAGLRQLQASMIERVEVITNPSARYEAEGQGGIINIVLKKDAKQGFNGTFEIISGQPTNYGFSANVNYRQRKVNFFVNYGLSYRWNPYRGDNFQEVYTGDTTRILKQENKGDVSGFDNNVRAGLDFYLSDKSTLTGSYLFSRAGGVRYTKNTYHDFLNTIGQPLGVVSRVQDEIEKEPLSEYMLQYKRSLKGNDLTAQIRYVDHFEKSDQIFTQWTTFPDGTSDFFNPQLQTSINDEYEKQYLFQIDYQQPFAKNGKWEFGGRASLRQMVNDYVVNNVVDQRPMPIEWLDNKFLYDENISAAYAIVSDKKKKLGYQVGLRSEWTNVTTQLEKTNEINPRKYYNLFPSTHVTWMLNTKNSLQASYSKRIKRPVYNDLSPFMTVSDSRNFMSGNPNLNPEYSDVYDIGFLKDFKNATLSSSFFFRTSQAHIFAIRRVNPDGFATSMPENLKSEKAYGLDMTANWQVFKWWKTDFNFNVFHANIDGSNIDDNYVTETNSWFCRQNSRFTLPHGFDTQIRFNYEAPQKTVQGSRGAIYFFDFSVKKDVWSRKGVFNFSILDIFNTRWTRTVSEGPGFYTESNRQLRPRQINLTFTYKIKA